MRRVSCRGAVMGWMVVVACVLGVGLWGCGQSAQQRGATESYSPPGNASYGIVSEYRENSELCGLKIGMSVSVDASYAQRVEPRGTDGYDLAIVGRDGDIEVKPEDPTLGVSPDLVGPGNENDYWLEVSKSGRLLRVGGIDEESGTPGAGRPSVGTVVDLAALYNVFAAPGGYPAGRLHVGQTWADRVPVTFADLGSHEISCESKVIAFERLNGKDCAVIESTVEIPVGEIYAALVAATGEDVRLESSGVCTVHARSHVTRSGRTLVQSEGDFSQVLPLKVYDRRKPMVWIEGEEPREFEWPAESEDAKSESEETVSGMSTAKGTFRVTME